MKKLVFILLLSLASPRGESKILFGAFRSSGAVVVAATPTCSTSRDTKTGTTTSSYTADGSFGYYSSRFTAAATYTACKCVVKLSKTGATGTLRVGLFTDDALTPGTLIGWSSTVDASTLTGVEGDVEFTGSWSIVNTTIYHFVIDVSGITAGSVSQFLIVDADNFTWAAAALPAWEILGSDESFKFTFKSN